MTTPETAPVKRPIDFTRVDALRRAMLLTVGDIASLFGVSRQTYYAWRDHGSNPRGVRLTFVKARVKWLLSVMTEHSWPTPEVISAKPTERYGMLLALMPLASNGAG